ncbi:MAG: DUF6279 family lipoprotein [Gammaproteobacteria bacterium]
MTVRQTKAIFVIALVAFVAACSFKTVYNRLDYLIPEYIEGVVSLDEVLEEKLEDRVLVLLQWHRNTQLKQYASWLNALQGDMTGQLTEQQLDQRISEMEGFWSAFFIKLNDEMAYLLPLLDEKQQDELNVYLEDSNEEFREEFIERDDDERVEDYTERMIDTYENWIGELADEQVLAVEQSAAQLISSAELRLQRRIRWQLGIRTILARDDTTYDKRERLRAFLAGFEQDYDPVLNETTEINRRVIISLTVEIAKSMTQDQKAFFISKTNDYIRMFMELAENR